MVMQAAGSISPDLVCLNTCKHTHTHTHTHIHTTLLSPNNPELHLQFNYRIRIHPQTAMSLNNKPAKVVVSISS